MGLLDLKLNSSPRPELFSSPGLLLAHPWSAQPQSAQPQSLPGVPNPRVPSPRVSLPKEGGDVRSKTVVAVALAASGLHRSTWASRIRYVTKRSSHHKGPKPLRAPHVARARRHGLRGDGDQCRRAQRSTLEAFSGERHVLETPHPPRPNSAIKSTHPRR